MESHSTQNLPHQHHPLYAFLQSNHSKTSPTTQSLDHTNPPTHCLQPSHPDNHGEPAAVRHLSSLITSVRAHSHQLDQMVNHLNSLVTRVESVETIFSQGQEQLHQMASGFRTDAAAIALQTGDRVNGTLEPALNSFNHRVSSLFQKLEAIQATVVQQNKTCGDHASNLAQLEKNMQHLDHQLNQLNTRANFDKAENVKRNENLEQELKKLNSALEPNSVLVPLLRAFLESQLRSTSSLQHPMKSFEKGDPHCGEKDSTHRTQLNTRVRSFGTSIRRNSVARHVSSGLLECPQTSTRVFKTIQRAGSNLSEDHRGIDCQEDGGTIHGRMQSSCHTETERVTSVHQCRPPEKDPKKVAAEPEPTVTQDSAIDSRPNSQVKQGTTGAPQMVDSPDRVFSHTLIGTKTAQLDRVGQKTGQQDSASRRLVDKFDDAMRNNPSKRSRSTKSPEFESKLIRSDSILTQRKVSFKRTQTSSTIASKNDLQSQSIKAARRPSVEYKKPIKKKRRPLLMGDGRDTEL